MRNRLVLVFAGLALLTLTACTSVPSATDIPAAIANASTASDHRRIADFYAEKAVSYDAEKVFHEKMSRSYFGRPKGDPAAWVAHCNALMQKFTEAAQEVRALEQAHRRLADSK